MVKHKKRDFLSDVLVLFECIGSQITVCKYMCTELIADSPVQ